MRNGRQNRQIISKCMKIMTLRFFILQKLLIQNINYVENTKWHI